MNKDILELAAEIEKLIEKYDPLPAYHWRNFKSELMNIITKYE